LVAVSARAAISLLMISHNLKVESARTRRVGERFHFAVI
jgi:hypothetical protein